MLAAGDAGAVSNRRDVGRRAEREDQCSRLTTAALREPAAAGVETTGGGGSVPEPPPRIVQSLVFTSGCA